MVGNKLRIFPEEEEDSTRRLQMQVHDNSNIKEENYRGKLVKDKS